MRKHRGLKQYYKSLTTKEECWSGLNFTDPEKAWFNRWHTHFDWRGYGNESFRRRKPHLDKMFRHFDLLAEKARLLTTNYQMWITLFYFDSYNDALYLHTPNLNHKNFPQKINNLDAKSTLTNRALQEYVNNLEGYEIQYGHADEAYCVLYKKGISLPI